MTQGGWAMLSPAHLLGVWERARTSFWLVPALMALAAAGLSFGTIALDRALGSEALQAWGWAWSGGADGARSVLSTIAGSMATVAGVVFSVNIVALTLASSQFGPRLLRNFTRDLGNQLVLGTFISTFLYCLLVLRVVRSTHEGGFVPEVSITCAVLLAVGGVGVLIYFIGHVANAIQAESLIAVVGRELRDQIVAQYAEGPARDAGCQSPEVPEGLPQAVRATTGGNVQGVANDILVAAAAADLGTVLRVLCRPGDFVQAHETLVLVHCVPGPLNGDAAARIRTAFALGPRRTPTQDVRYGARQLTEIAVRALSPGINNPATAMGCLDWLGDALAEMARRVPAAAGHCEGGRMRVLAQPVTFAELAELSITPIRTYGASDPAVTLHLIRTLARIGRDGSGPDRAALLCLAEQAGEDALRANGNEADRARLAAAAAAARTALAPDPADLYGNRDDPPCLRAGTTSPGRPPLATGGAL